MTSAAVATRTAEVAPARPPDNRPSIRWVSAGVAVLVLVAGTLAMIRRGAGEQPFAGLGVLRPEVQKRAGEGSFGPAADGATLAVGDTLRTDRTGQAEIEYFDGSYTRLDVETTYMIQDLVDEPGERQIGARLEVGRTWNRVTKLTTSEGRFEVETPNAVATVRGTAFVVDCRDLPECTFIVIEGSVEVRTVSGERILLRAGEQVTIGPDGSLGEVRSLSAADLRGDPWVRLNLRMDDQLGFATSLDQAAEAESASETDQDTTALEPTPSPSALQARSSVGPGTTTAGSSSSSGAASSPSSGSTSDPVATPTPTPMPTPMPTPAPVPSPTTTRASVTSSGDQAGGASGLPDLSDDGRYVAFASNASDLVAGDTNGATDVFVHDRETGTTERVSLSSGAVEGDGASSFPAISGDGRYVAFDSAATNLVAGDTNGVSDVFVRDRQTGTTERVSISNGGAEANGASVSPSISYTGAFVAFRSVATNLVAGDTNGVADIFVRDLLSGTTERVSVSSDGTEGNGVSTFPVISGDGNSVAFESVATNLVAGDTNGAKDIFVRDRAANTTERMSVSDGGAEADGPSGAPDISSNGRYVVFHSDATNLVGAPETNGASDIFIRDRVGMATEKILGGGTLGDEANAGSFAPSISGDGRYVVFDSDATNLVAGDTNGVSDVFWHDRFSDTTERVSLTNAGEQANAGSFAPVGSVDGRYVVFDSDATNLVTGDTNAVPDIFVRDRTG